MSVRVQPVHCHVYWYCKFRINYLQVNLDPFALHWAFLSLDDLLAGFPLTLLSRSRIRSILQTRSWGILFTSKLAKETCFEVSQLQKHKSLIRTCYARSNKDAIPRMLKEHGLVLSCTSAHIVMRVNTKKGDFSSRFLVSHITSCYQLLIATGLDNGYKEPHIWASPP